MLRRLFKLAVIVALLCGAAWLLVRQAEKGWLQRKLKETASRYIGGDIQVGACELHVFDRRMVAHDVALRTPDESTPSLVLPVVQFGFPLGLTEEHRLAPDEIHLQRPVLRLDERADGTFSPLHLLKPWPATKTVPTVEIEDGTLFLRGAGQLSHTLDRILVPTLERRVEKVRFATFPMPPTARDLLGFSGNFVLPGVTPVEVHGSVGRDNALHLQATIDGLDLGGTGLRDDLQPRIRSLFDRFVTAGRCELSLAVDAAPDQDGKLFARMLLHDLRCHVPELFKDDFAIEGASGELIFDGKRLSLVNGRLPHGADVIEVEGEVADVFADPPSWHVIARADGLHFEDHFVAAIVAPELRRAIDDYAPSGTFDLRVDVAKAGAAAPVAHWSIVPRETDAAFVSHVRANGKRTGFPYRLKHLTGSVSGDGDRIEIRHVSGDHTGGGRAEVNGVVLLFPADDDEDLTLRITAENVPIDAMMRASIESALPGAGALLDSFHPRGSVDVDVHADEPKGVTKTRVYGRVSARDLAVKFDPFPVPLEHVNGAVEFDGDIFRLQHLTSKCGPGTLTIDGVVTVSDHEHGLDLKISARDVVADAALKEALVAAAPAAEEWWGALDPCGPFDLDLDVQQPVGGEIKFRALLSPKGLKVVPRWLPIPIEGVVGRVAFGNLHDGDPSDSRFYVHLETLHAKNRGGDVALIGRFGDDVPSVLDVRGDHVNVDDPLLDKLNSVPFANGVDVTPVLKSYRPNGPVSFRYSFATPPQAGAPAIEDRLLVLLDGVECSVDVLPGGKLTDLTGRLAVDFATGSVRLDDFSGSLRDVGTRVKSRSLGVAVESERITLEGDVEFDDLPFDERLLPLLHPTLKEFFETRAPSGKVDVDLSQLRVRAPLPGKSESTPGDSAIGFTGDVRFEQCRLERPFKVENFAGHLHLAGSGGNAEHQSFKAAGNFDDLGFKIGRVALAGLSGNLAVGADGVLLSEVSGPFAGGQLDPKRCQFELRPDEPGAPFSGSVAVDHAEIAELVRDFTPRRPDLSGTLDARFAFKGSGESLMTFSGEGEARVTNGRLWSLPALARLYSLSYLKSAFGSSPPPTFETCDARFHVRDGLVDLDEFELRAPTTMSVVGLNLKGSGVVGPSGLDVKVRPEVIQPNLIGVTQFFDLLKKGILTYRVYGPLGNPRVVWWNLAKAALDRGIDPTRMPRLTPRPEPDWDGKF